MLRQPVALAVFLALGWGAPLKAQHAGAVAELYRSCGAEIRAAHAEQQTSIHRRGPIQGLENWFIGLIVGNISSVELRKGQVAYAREVATVQRGYEEGYRYMSCAQGVAARLKEGSSSAGTPRKKPAPAGPLKTTISAQQARDNAVDAALRREIDALIARFKVTGVCTWRAGAIQDPCVKNNAQRNILLTDAVLASLEAQRGKVSENYYRRVKTPWENVRVRIVADCAKLASSTTACGLPAPDSAYGKKSRIIARDGRSAMDCVKLVTISKGDSSTTGLGNRVLSNQCNGPVQVGWCYVGGECERGAGNSWTIGPQRSWPVSAVKEIRWGACHGANTIHGDPGSKGLQFTCSKPAK